MKDNYRIDIESDQLYECVVNSKHIIIEVKPLCNTYLYKDIKEIYDRFRGEAVFRFIGYVDPKSISPEEIFEWFMYLNPDLKILVEEFDCDLL